MSTAYILLTFKRTLLHHPPEAPTNSYQVVRIRNALNVKFSRQETEQLIEIGTTINGDKEMLRTIRLMSGNGIQFQITL